MTEETPEQDLKSAPPSGGYVFRTNDGSLYLIRDEILEACRMEEPDLEYARQQEKFKITEGPFSEVARVDYKQATRWKDREVDTTEVVASTTMCGW